MRRVAAAVLLLLALAGCADQTRPEGVVERWLLALNQGSAGEPERFADAAVSEEVLPRWDEREPGELDVIEVASAGGSLDACDEDQLLVPFRVVPLEGEELVAGACVSGSRIVRLTGSTGVPRSVFPSEGGTAVEATTGSAWWAAVGVGLGLALVGEAAMRLVRVREPG